MLKYISVQNSRKCVKNFSVKKLKQSVLKTLKNDVKILVLKNLNNLCEKKSSLKSTKNLC